MVPLPNSPPCVFRVWDCLVYCCSVGSSVVWVSSMFCPPLHPDYVDPPALCALVPGLLFAWLFVFGLLG